jgi:hypothetical protein
VGQDQGNQGGTPYAVALAGKQWKPVSVRLPEGSQDFVSLDGVSCKTAAYCLVIGTYQDTSDHPFALTWNGSSLKPTPAPPVPGGDSLNSAGAVSCVAVKSCVAFGSAYDSKGNTVNLVWTWNGSKWTAKAAVLPGRGQNTAFAAAKCFSRTSCEVGGSYDTYTMSGAGIAKNSRPLLAAWNGTTLSLQNAAIPAGLSDGYINGLSCASPSSCAATGNGDTVAVAGRTRSWSFLETWNGQRWAVAKWTGPKGSPGLGGVSCATATNCVAVGTAANAASLAWNGTKWLAGGVPSAGKGLIDTFEDVSCPKAGDCVAIGEYGQMYGTAASLLAGRWNGHSWKLGKALSTGGAGSLGAADTALGFPTGGGDVTIR